MAESTPLLAQGDSNSASTTATEKTLQSSEVVNRKYRIYADLDVSKHSTAADCWVSHKGFVYDLTSFLPDHPGGDDIIVKYAGKDIDLVMVDENEHVHSKAAFEMMKDYAVGRLVRGAKICDDNWEATDDFHPDDTDAAADYETNQFLDLSKPLLKQVFYSNFSKEFYLEQVHQPRHIPGGKSALLFGPAFLEGFTLTPWYVVPLVWLPISALCFYLSSVQWSDPSITFAGLRSVVWNQGFSALPTPTFDNLFKTSLGFLLGNFLWTLLEYAFHRFLFHMDSFLPDKSWALTLHFLLHGIHHYLPMDQMRLVMPPTLFFALETPVTILAYKIFPVALANGGISGAFAFYVLYDCMHYALHHTKLPSYLAMMKKYHLGHHYQNYELAFGITSKVWDLVFGTELIMVTK